MSIINKACANPQEFWENFELFTFESNKLSDHYPEKPEQNPLQQVQSEPKLSFINHELTAIVPHGFANEVHTGQLRKLIDIFQKYLQFGCDKQQLPVKFSLDRVMTSNEVHYFDPTSTDFSCHSKIWDLAKPNLRSFLASLGVKYTEEEVERKWESKLPYFGKPVEITLSFDPLGNPCEVPIEAPKTDLPTLEIKTRPIRTDQRAFNADSQLLAAMTQGKSSIDLQDENPATIQIYLAYLNRSDPFCSDPAKIIPALDFANTYKLEGFTDYCVRCLEKTMPKERWEEIGYIGAMCENKDASKRLLTLYNKYRIMLGKPLPVETKEEMEIALQKAGLCVDLQKNSRIAVEVNVDFEVDKGNTLAYCCDKSWGSPVSLVKTHKTIQFPMPLVHIPESDGEGFKIDEKQIKTVWKGWLPIGSEFKFVELSPEGKIIKWEKKVDNHKFEAESLGANNPTLNFDSQEIQF